MEQNKREYSLRGTTELLEKNLNDRRTQHSRTVGGV